MLEDDFKITNISQAGVSEYKIYLQLKSVDVTKFDKVLISHTSAYRIPIEEHPIHKNDILHNNCDIIFSDVKEHIDNPIMKTAYNFYSEIFYPKNNITAYNTPVNSNKYAGSLNSLSRKFLGVNKEKLIT